MCFVAVCWAFKSWVGWSVGDHRKAVVKEDRDRITPTGFIELVGEFVRKKSCCFSTATASSSPSLPPLSTLSSTASLNGDDFET